jgi:plastocyanin
MKQMTMRMSCAVACLALLATGCSSEVTDKPAATAGAAGAGKKVDTATAGVVTGVVKFEGVVPAAEIIRMTTDKKCITDAGPNPQSDALLIADDKSVANAFVYVKDGLDPAYSFDVPTDPVVLDQKGCIYTPRVLGVRVGQAIGIVNSDPTMHNVHAMPMSNREFNHSQPKQFTKISEVFTTPEVMVRFKCDLHGWMAAHVGVVAHPYFAVTDKAGEFSLPNLPPGSYTLEAWHEKLGRQTAQVTIAAGQKLTSPITFTASPK